VCKDFLAHEPAGVVPQPKDDVSGDPEPDIHTAHPYYIDMNLIHGLLEDKFST